jgi:hypothetical protein
MNDIDWQKVTLNIRSKYKNLCAVGKEVGSDWAHLNRLARGEVEQPKFSVGIRLLDLHYDHCKDQHSKIFKGQS